LPVRARFGAWSDDYKPGTWRNDVKRSGGGFVFDSASHWIRPLTMWFGPMDSVLGTVGTQHSPLPLPPPPPPPPQYSCGARLCVWLYIVRFWVHCPAVARVPFVGPRRAMWCTVVCTLGAWRVARASLSFHLLLITAGVSDRASPSLPMGHTLAPPPPPSAHSSASCTSMRTARTRLPCAGRSVAHMPGESTATALFKMASGLVVSFEALLSEAPISPQPWFQVQCEHGEVSVRRWCACGGAVPGVCLPCVCVWGGLREGSVCLSLQPQGSGAPPRPLPPLLSPHPHRL
jgi:hypothetical protein